LLSNRKKRKKDLEMKSYFLFIRDKWKSNKRKLRSNSNLNWRRLQELKPYWIKMKRISTLMQSRL
jgi:predicted transcriptional regulator